MSQAERARPQDQQRGWLSRRLPNWWLRCSFPALIIFGGGFALRVLFGGTDIALYAATAMLAVVGLAVGLVKARRRSS